MKETIKFIAIVTILTSFLCGCKRNDNVTIGIIVPLTGEVATYGQDLKKGMDIAFEEEENFIPLYQDSKSNPQEALKAMQYLRGAKDVWFFIGDATTTVSLTIAEDAQRNGSFLLVPIASGDEICNKGDMVFMNCPRNEKQAVYAAKYVIGQYYGKRVGVIYQQIHYGQELANCFTSELLDNEMEVVFCEGVQDVRSGLRSLIAKAKKANLDLVFMPMEYEVGASVLKQCREQSITADFIGTDGSYSQKLIDLARDAAEGYCFTMFPMDQNGEYYKNFADSYRNKYNNEPNIFACYGYESAKNLMCAIKGAGANPRDVMRFFHDNTFNSLTGTLRFDSIGSADRQCCIYTIQNHQFIQKNIIHESGIGDMIHNQIEADSSIGQSNNYESKEKYNNI